MTLARDLKYGFRKLVKNPVFTLIAALSLAVGIGGTTTIFSLVNGLLLRPLPGVENQDQLVNVYHVAPDGELDGLSTPNFRDLRPGNEVFTSMAGFADRAMSLRVGREPELELAQIVTGEYFTVLQVQPAAGRLLSASDDEVPGGHPVVVISHELWERRFGADPGVAGTEVSVNGVPFTVIGVAEEGFGGTFVGFVFDLWVPAAMVPQVQPSIDLDEREGEWMEVIARLAPGMSMEQAEAEVVTRAERLAQEYPDDNRGKTARLTPLSGYDEGLRAGMTAFLAILLVVSAAVLVIACVNVANMLLARSTERAKEVAIRLSLGVSRAKLMRQLLIESVLLALTGGIGGVLLALWGIRAVRTFEPPIPLPLVFDVRLDFKVLLFALALSVLAGVAFGLVPALQATRPDLVSAIKASSSKGSGRSRLRNLFVVGQVAFSLLLLVCTGLFLRTLSHAANSDPGFQAERVLMVTLDPSVLGTRGPDAVDFHLRLSERLAALPGVESAAITRGVPLGIGGLLGGSTAEVEIEGYELPPDQEALRIEHRVVGSGYFETLAIPLIEGRGFERTDRADSAPVAVINRTMAERFWPDRSPVGQRMRVDETEVEIVGMAQSSKYRRPNEDPMPFLFRPFQQRSAGRQTHILRTAGAPAGMAPSVRREIQAMAPDQPVLELVPMEQHIAISLLPQRMAVSVSGVLGLVGLLLAAIGIYGVVSYSVHQREREMGVRLSLGAQQSDLLRMVVIEGMRLALIGVVVGLVVAGLLARFLEGFLFGISTFDPLTFGSIALLLLLIALVSCYFPARRVSRIDPTIAVRGE